ncbi:MAG: type II toxin-antitoxin system HipA family toxin YjjJ [Chthoniobacterales bacterium]
MSNLQQLIRLAFLRKGTMTARELAEDAGVSQPTISRALTRMGGSVVRIGRGSSTRYGLEAQVADLGSRWPLYVIGSGGAPEQAGVLQALVGGGFHLERSTEEHWTTLVGAQFPKGMFPGLPWFLDDVRPQGFLGRAFARRHASPLGQGLDPALWSQVGVLESLIRYGSDLPGAFVIGHHALTEALAMSSRPAVKDEERAVVYPLRAEEALQGNIAGSSAGGEQPKFTATLSSGGSIRSVVVKFSPELHREEGRRWADLLAGEKIAADILRENGMDVPQVELIDAENRRFLEVARFDRSREGGRIAAVSLRSFAAAFLDEINAPWSVAGDAMHREGWLAKVDAEKLSSLWKFGQLIGNTDMHYGNASFLLSQAKPLTLAPVYDMLPMAYRPVEQSGVPGISEALLGLIGAATQGPESLWARAFWARLHESELVSEEFRQLAARHVAAFPNHTSVI